MEFAGIIFLGKMAILLLFSNYLAKRPFLKKKIFRQFFFFFNMELSIIQAVLLFSNYLANVKW